jgi:hypothetical protein
MSAPGFDKGVADLHRTAEADGPFGYTSLKAGALNGPHAERRAPRGATL